jgi:hypothetical protein
MNFHLCTFRYFSLNPAASGSLIRTRMKRTFIVAQRPGSRGETVPAEFWTARCDLKSTSATASAGFALLRNKT